jgi:uncharacterized protein (DUF4415 family)
MANLPNPYLIDDENPEWTDEMLEQAIARKVLENKSRINKTVGQRGKQVAPLKQIVTIRLDTDIVEKFKATGSGWQSRVNNALRDVQIAV